MTEDVKQEVNPNDEEMESVAIANVGASELDEAGRPKLQVLDIAKIQKDIPNYKWIDIFKDDPNKRCAVKVLIGDALLLQQALGKDDLMYMFDQADTPETQEDLESRIEMMDTEEKIEMHNFNQRLSEAQICTFILEPKFCPNDKLVDGAIPMSEVSEELKTELIGAYNEAHTPEDALD